MTYFANRRKLFAKGKKKAAVATVAALAALCLLVVVGLAEAEASGQIVRINHGPILGRPGTQSMAIWARTSMPGGFQVRYGTRPQKLDQLSLLKATTLDHDNANWIEITGLKPGTRYYYEVFVPEGPSSTAEHRGTFRTLPDRSDFVDSEVNPRGLYSFSFEFACGNRQDSTDASMPAYGTMLQRIADYYGLISHMDTQIGRIMEALAAAGLEENTLIVFASDNGLALGRHGLMGKQNLYDHTVRVPLIVAGPGVLRARRTDALCYLHDLFPTILDTAGLTAPDGCEGKSLWPLLRGEANDHRSTLFFAYGVVQRAIKSDGWKLIQYPQIGKTQLFNLLADPAETDDLADHAKHQERRTTLQRLLMESQKYAHDPILLGNNQQLPK